MQEAESISKICLSLICQLLLIHRYFLPDYFHSKSSTRTNTKTLDTHRETESARCMNKSRETKRASFVRRCSTPMLIDEQNWGLQNYLERHAHTRTVAHCYIVISNTLRHLYTHTHTPHIQTHTHTHTHRQTLKQSFRTRLGQTSPEAGSLIVLYFTQRTSLVRLKTS